MRKQSLSGGRMRAGARRRLTHESQQCVASRISRSITSWRAAKNERTDRPAHKRPPTGRREQHRPKGAPHSSVAATRWRSTSPAALRTIWARRRVPR